MKRDWSLKFPTIYKHLNCLSHCKFAKADARLFKYFMEEAEIDISNFKAHSVRGASCSSAAGAGVTTKDILDTADWSEEGTFQ